jgi:hypothetical protein
MALTQQSRAALGGSETSARRRHGIIQEHGVEIEFDESEPTIQQLQAYERFWKLLLERIVRKRQLDK